MLKAMSIARCALIYIYCKISVCLFNADDGAISHCLLVVRRFPVFGVGFVTEARHAKSAACILACGRLDEFQTSGIEMIDHVSGPLQAQS